MTLYTHKNKEILDITDRKNINDYVRRGIFELEKKGYSLNLADPLDAKRMKELLNDSKNTTFKSVRSITDGLYYWHEQNVDFIRSNLGRDRGQIFYFLCNGCNRRVKYLYEYNFCYSPLCRKCCRIGYKYPSGKSKKLSKLLRKPYLSSEDKQAIIKYAGITREDITA